MTDLAPAKRDWKDNRLARLFIMFFAIMFLYSAGQAASMLGAKYAPEPYKGAMALAAVGVLIVIGIWAYVWLVRVFEKKPVADLVPGAAPLGLIKGAIIGMVIISAVIAIMWAMGNARLVLATPPVLPLAIVAMACISGVFEEILFRGILFRIPEEMFGTLVALIISSAFFGGIHIFNPHATAVSSAAIAIEAGLLLGFAYTATRSLWLPIGLHFGWNLTEGGVYSTSVSGHEIAHGVINTTLTGPEIITGGGFGPEASVVAVVVCSVLTLIFAVITFRRGEWQPLRFRIRAG